MLLIFPMNVEAEEALTVVTIDSHVPVYEYAAEKFEEEYGIPVDIVSQAYDQTHEVIVTAVVGRSPGFDVAAIDTIYVSNYAQAGIVDPLDVYADQRVFDEHLESSLDMLTSNDRVYSLGGGYNYLYFYYNERMLEEAGFTEPPATWNELVEMSQALQEEGIVDHGIAWGWTQAEGLICYYTLLLNAFEGSYFNEEGELVVNTPEAQETLQFMYDTIHSYEIADPASTELTDREVMESFLSEDVAFVMNWDFGWAWSQDPSRSDVVDDARVGLVPGTENVVSSTTGGGSGPAIISTSEKKEEAWQFIEFFNRDEMQMDYLTELNILRITKKALLDEAILEEEPYATMFEQQQYAYPRARVSWYPQFSSTLQLEIHRALTGEKDIAEALEDAQNRINDYIERFGI